MNLRSLPSAGKQHPRALRHLPLPSNIIKSCSPSKPRVLTQAVAEANAAPGGVAVVLGSGMSGLSTAKVLSKHFSTVKVLERDSISSEWTGETAVDASKSKGRRRGVGQYNHLHVLAAAGVLTLDRLFEGRFIPALQQKGAVLNDVITSFLNYHPLTGGRWKTPDVAARGPVLIGQATRHLVESATRELLQDAPSVEVTYGAAVTGLMLQEVKEKEGAGDSSGGSRHKVTGVSLADGSQLAADLVVDCSGRQSQMPQWLAAAGLNTPREAEVNANLGYASWLVKLDPEVAARTLGRSKGIYAIATFPHTVGAAVTEVEGGLHMAGIITYAGNVPPYKDDQLMDFMAQELWHPDVAAVLEGAVPMTRPSRFHRVSSTWRRYEEVTLPEGLLVTADSVCNFNPVYGHGMTVAALEAEKLGQLLAARRAAAVSGQAEAGSAGSAGGESWLSGLSQEYQQAIIPIIQRAWDLSVGGDLRFSSTTSTEPPNPAAGFMNGYFDILMVLAAKDPEVSEQLLRTMHLIDDTAELTSPRMLGKVVRHLVSAPFVKLWSNLQPGTGSTDTQATSKAAGQSA